MGIALGDGEYATGKPYSPPSSAERATSPNTTCAWWDDMSPVWNMAADMMAGTRAMQAAGETYLPMLPGEEDDAYEERLERSIFFNGFKRAVKMLAGLPFAEPVTLGEKAPKDVQDWWQDLDRTARHGDVFAKDCLRDQLSIGGVGLLVDYAAVNPQTITQGEKLRRGLRPYVTQVDVRDVIFWRSVVIDGKELLTHLRIRENTYEADGEWGEKLVNRVRVFDRVEGDPNATDPAARKTRVTWRLFKSVQKSDAQQEEWVKQDDGVLDGPTEIPFTMAYGERAGFMRAKPPLEDGMWTSLDHYRSSSDQRHCLHTARVPIIFGKGFTPAGPGQKSGRVTIGPNRGIFTTETEADMKFVEHTGAAIAAGRQNLEDLKEELAMLTAEKLAKRTAGPAVTATEQRHDNDQEDSDLASMVRSLEDALDQAIYWMCQFAKVDPPAERVVEIDKEFGDVAANPQLLESVRGLRTDRQITQATLLEVYKDAGALPETLDVEEEISKTQDEGPDGQTGPFKNQADPVQQMMDEHPSMTRDEAMNAVKGRAKGDAIARARGGGRQIQ